MITSTELARLIAVYSYKTGTKDASSIAGSVGLAPLYIINAYNRGEMLNMFTLKRDKTGIKSIRISDEQFSDIALLPENFGSDFTDVYNSVIELIMALNSRDNDLSKDQLMLWSGASPFMIETVLYVAFERKVLAEYEIKDKYDQKSVYKFITLYENKDKKFGQSQFKK